MLLVELRVRAALTLAGLLVLGACGGNTADEGGGSNEPTGAGSASGNASTASGAGADNAGGGHHLGEPRDDVERFFGLYGEQGVGQFFVVEAKRPPEAEQAPEIPPGYLSIGAMWADVAPWYMKSLSDNTFEQANKTSFGPQEMHVAEFEFGPDGKAVALTFTKGSSSKFGRRERVGDVPEEWR